MTIPLPLRFKGVPGSPYTRKMLALLRYRHLPYELLLGDQASALGMPEPKVSLLPTFYLPGASGRLEAVVDSTPLIRRFEAEFKARAAIPANPVLSFLNYLLEDYADEWLTKAMFHYRWYYAADIERAGTILPLWTGISASPEQMAARKQFVAERQISRLYVVGSNDTTAPVIEASYRRFLAAFDRLLQRQPFVLGSRPASADFALYAQLTQLAKFDPTPMAICLEEAPRVFAWVDLVDDLSGNPAADTDWMDAARVGETLGELLTEVGRVYVPALLANAAALEKGEQQMSTTIDGRAWTQPAFPYQAKCLHWIRQEFAALRAADADVVRQLLEGTGCEPLLSAGN
ncbi:MAG: glutathione S-transferase C-terminal domain-containing protein [Pseudomonadales bacterium]|nr:glutathione S-transferase family protein [Pseudomonadales bacterium]